MEKEHFEVILEDINSKIDLIVEGRQALDKKIDDKVAELKSDIKEVDTKVEFVHRSLDKKIDNVTEELKGEIKKVETKLDKKIDDKTEEVKSEIRAVRDVLEGHEERIERLEQRA